MFQVGLYLASRRTAMSCKVVERSALDLRGSLYPPVEAGAGGVAEGLSTMLSTPVKSDREEIPSTESASPSRLDITRTSDSIPPAAPKPPVNELPTSRATHVRDPARYQVLGEHGRGGLGRVSRAHDGELGRDVAIKELISRTPTNEIRFLREALITARLEHPGIVPVHEAGRWPDGTPFYAMKLVSGRSLRALIAESNTVEKRIRLLHHVIAVADAIAYAHGRGVIHRDLKPANVIVGDFGETIVIDWGLAKDLTSTDEPPAVDTSSRSYPTPDNGLTAAGTVLGTPAYMAPEQERGEQVDRRADVFAIGAMLWELCALQKVPPTDARRRHRLLRRSGIDKDLATILDKALDPDPKHRYLDAGALAADLKAFESGARIAARSYSLPAMLAHWMRRHRTLAVSTTLMLMLAIGGSAFYVHSVSAERDRADLALTHVRAAKNDLTLEHAELLLRSDPTSAIEALSTYLGEDKLRRHRLIAEARGLGVATTILTPHNDTVWFLRGTKLGEIISLGEDSRLQLTQNRTSTVIATDVSSAVRVAYVSRSNLLAYARAPTGVTIIDLDTMSKSLIDDVHPYGMSFSLDGELFAIIDDRGELFVWSIASNGIRIILRRSFLGAFRLKFATSKSLVIQDNSMVHLVLLDAHNGEERKFKIAGISSVDANADAVAIGSTDGTVKLLSASLDLISNNVICRGQVNAVQFIRQTQQIAFSCQDGYSGVASYDLSTANFTVIDTFPTHGSTIVASDPLGRYVTATDETHTAYVYDLETRLVHRYVGNAGQPSYIAVPTPEFPYVLVGDSNGTVRAWDRPPVSTRTVFRARVALWGLAFSPDNTALLVNGGDSSAWYLKLQERSLIALTGHRAGILGASMSSDGTAILTYSYDGTVRIWRTSDAALLRSFAEHGSLVEEAAFYEGGKRVVSVGDDGRLLAWSPYETTFSVLFKHSVPLTRLEILSHSNHILIQDITGAVWDISPDASSRQLRNRSDDSVTVLRASPDGRFAAIGTSTGEVVIYETSNWSIVNTVKNDGGIRQIVFDPMNRDILVASEAGRSQSGHIQLVALNEKRIHHWQIVNAAVRNAAYSADGEILSFVCADGGTWLYSLRSDAWFYSNDHRSDTLTATFSGDGRLFATTDRRGAVIIRDMSAIFATPTQERKRQLP
jgi:eukaryotic-like serine/threonine-protein kinase